MTDPLREAAMQRLKASIEASAKRLESLKVLPPCPFCGSVEIETIKTDRDRWFTVCLDCRSRTAELPTRERAERLWIGTRGD